MRTAQPCTHRRQTAGEKRGTDVGVERANEVVVLGAHGPEDSAQKQCPVDCEVGIRRIRESEEGETTLGYPSQYIRARQQLSRLLLLLRLRLLRLLRSCHVFTNGMASACELQ